MTNEQPITDDIPPKTMPASGDTDVSSDRSLSLAEAAERLGVSERTVLRRIRKGQLQAHKADTPYGPGWRVTLDISPDGAPPTVSTTPDNMPTTGDTAPMSPEFMKMLEIVEEDRRLIDRLQRENQQMAGQLGFVQAKLQEAEKTIALLMAPKDDSADVTPKKPPVEPEPLTEPVRVSWWRRLFS